MLLENYMILTENLKGQCRNMSFLFITAIDMSKPRQAGVVILIIFATLVSARIALVVRCLMPPQIMITLMQSNYPVIVLPLSCRFFLLNFYFPWQAIILQSIIRLAFILFVRDLQCLFYNLFAKTIEQFLSIASVI